MTHDKTALVEMGERQADGDLVRAMMHDADDGGLHAGS